MPDRAHRAPTRSSARRALRRMSVGVLALATLAMSAGIARADVVVNSVAATGSTTVVANGTSTTEVSYTIQNTNKQDTTYTDSEQPCNADKATPATLTVNVPSDVTVTPASRVYQACDVAQAFTFKAMKAGNYSITVSVADGGSGTYYTAPASFTLVATAPAPTAVATSLSAPNASAAYDATTVDLTATLTSNASAVAGKTVEFKVGTRTVGSGTTDAQGVATYSYSLNKTVAAGSYSVSASWAGDATHAATTSAAGTLTVSQATQTISFLQPADKSYGDSAFTVSPSASSGLAVSVSSSTTGVCTVSGNQVTITSAGTCTLAADQGGNSNWAAAPQVTRSLEVARADQTINFAFNPQTATYGDGPVTVSASSSAGTDVVTSVKEGPCTLTGTSLTISGGGDCVVIASAPASTNYNAASIERTLSIARANQAITFTAPSGKTFGDAPFSLSGSSDSGLPVAYAVNSGPCSVTNGTLTIEGAGDCVVTASQAGNTNYNPATSIQRTIVIAKADQEITFTAPTGKTFGDAPFVLGAATSSGLPVSYTIDSGNCSIDASTLTMEGAGDCVVTASQDGDDDHNPAEDVTRTIVIAKASQVITFTAPTGKTFGDSPFSPGATASSGLAVTYTTPTSGPCTVADGLLIMTGAGTCTVTAHQGGNGNVHPATSVTRSFAIAKANQLVPVALSLSSTTAYFGDLITPSASGGEGSGLFHFDATGTACRMDAGKVLITAGTGTCSVTATKLADDNYNAATSAAESIDVQRWTVRGFTSPIDGNGVWNTVKNGSTVPLKFEVLAGSNEFTTTTAIGATFTATGTKCPVTGFVADDVEVLSTGSTTLRYDAAGIGHFIQNWQTPKKPGACYVVTVAMQDGSQTSANVMLK